MKKNKLLNLNGWTLSNATNCLIENLEEALPPTRSNAQLISKFKELRRNARVIDWLVGQNNPQQHPLYAQLLQLNVSKTHQLKPGEFTLMPGYWRITAIQNKSENSNWHGIYYMLQKNNNDTFRFVVFNTGYGSDHHESNKFCDDDPRDFQAEIQNGSRKLEDFMFNPRFCIDQIPVEYIEHSLIKKLLDWSLGLETCTAGNFYRAITNFGTKTTLGEKDFLPQQDGTCTWRGLMSLFHYLADKRTRNTLEYRFRANSLLKSARQLEMLNITAQDRTLLTLATRSLRHNNQALIQQGDRNLIKKRTHQQIADLESTLGIEDGCEVFAAKRMKTE